jgi:hypothetical protein
MKIWLTLTTTNIKVRNYSRVHRFTQREHSEMRFGWMRKLRSSMTCAMYSWPRVQKYRCAPITSAPRQEQREQASRIPSHVSHTLLLHLGGEVRIRGRYSTPGVATQGCTIIVVGVYPLYALEDGI